MELGALADAELVDLARQGSAPAFAVLLHRHGPAVRAVVDNDEDPAGAVISTYVGAMRGLKQLPDDVPARTWLLELAASEVRDPLPVGEGRLPDLHPEERDEIWAELDVRWPNGKVKRHVPHWLGWAALVVALVSLGVLLPYVALTWGADDSTDLAWDTLRAEPFEDDAFVLEEEVEEDEVEEIEFELPSFDFSGNDEPAVESTPQSTPPPPDPVQEQSAVVEDPVEEDPVEEDPVEVLPVEDPDEDDEDDGDVTTPGDPDDTEDGGAGDEGEE